MWYIFHFERFTAQCHREEYQRRLSRYLNRQYNKADARVYTLLKDRRDEAIENAKWGHQSLMRVRGHKPSELESSTTVYQLVEELKKWE